MKKTLGLLIALALAPAAAPAADLLGLYNEAKGYDAQFAAARASLDAGRERLPQGRAGLLPTVGASANTVWNETNTTPKNPVPGVSIGRADYNTHGWAVNLTQPLFRWQNWVNYTQAELAVAIAEAQFTQAAQDLIVRVAQAYFDVLQAQEVLASTQAQRKAIAEQLESAKRNFEVGTSTIVDTHEAQARYDLADAQLIAAESDLSIKRQVLRTVVGKEHEDLKSLKTGVDIPQPQPEDINQWTKQAETANIGVQLAESSNEIADQEISKQRAGHFPTLDAVASRSSNSFGNQPFFGGYDNTATTLGLQLQIPIFAGGYTASKNSEAVALHQKSLADLEAARRGAALQARQAYLGVTSGLAQVKALEAAQVSSQSALDSNKLGYEVGVRINIDVLNSQSQYYDTRQKLMKARLDTLLAQLKLKAAAGNLTEADLKAVNALLD
ncbi:Type I secretion outer membrane protein, TolC precursor [Georgfuchsia toluolica]|uniref:Type I secretion outer membrane protein, TolC n=1 Tax=Georgfuchsia toluolica TaxID=424218 RepID=A0A916J656_9PROT|nr:TolC family outer membrane protein [Georgfuchsia toluolica]CAG4884703.1 Type I secretion outer membrane protein, TolC precursor [Georgfuchsia toluolica]